MKLLPATLLSRSATGTVLALLIASGATAQTAPAPVDAAPAQTAADAPSVADGADNGVIVVTAQKRAQNLQNVPLAVQVVSGQQLQSNGVRDFADLNRVAPSLVIRPAENPVNASVSIRGVGTFAFSIGVEPSVAVVVDDVPISFQARAFADLADIERIEVLRGPQSTLYGKSASAGLINIVTPGPSKTFTAKISALGTTDDEWQGNAVLSGPITENLGFRTTLNYDKYNGNVHNLADGHKVNGRRIFSTRNKLRWTPIDNITVDLGVDYINGRTTTGRPFIKLAQGALLRGMPALTEPVYAPGVTVGPDNRDVVNDYTTGTQYHDLAESLKVSWDMGGPTLMSITSHDKFLMHDQLDQDESAVSTLNNKQFGSFGSEQWTQELRLVSPGHDRFRYTLGLFYADVDYSRDFTRGPYFSQARWDATAKSIQEALFGQLEYDVLPHTTLIVGGRYSHEKVEYTFHDFLPPAGAPSLYAGSDGDNFGTYKIGLQQHVGDNVVLFGTYSTGHKGETYDLSTGFNINRTTPVKPETSKDWEVGARTQFFDKRVTLNVTLFDTHYKDFQAQGIENLADGTVNYRLTNVGKLRTRGVEVESSARVTNALTVGASVAYLDAKITDFPDAQCYTNQTAAQGCVPAAGAIPAHQNLSGSRPPQAPKWKLTANFDYSHDLGSLPFQGVITGAYTYQSEVNYSLNQDPQTIQKGYGIANLSIGIRQPDHRYEVMAFVNNLFDKQYYQNLTNSSGNYAGLLAIQSYLPRDFRRYAGVRASYSF
jgi:iron complex outermembrane receptor protein